MASCRAACGRRCCSVALIALTRGLHLDGLMDCCDGLFGGFTPERRLAIMRDSRVGAFGVLRRGRASSCCATARSSRSMAAGGWSGLILPPLLGRWAMALAIVAFPYGRAEGMGAAFKRAAGLAGRGWRRWRASVLARHSGGRGGWRCSFSPALVACCSLARFMLGRLGGLTGDCYGAINELVEVALLLIDRRGADRDAGG